ncbi:unnamed protein product [Rotaria sp. Silwood1]|nr:unnamed protein product [Rotaria sp. Silwood1]
MGFQSVSINGTSILHRYSPAPSKLDICACSVSFDCLDKTGAGGQFFCQHGDNCIPNTTVWSVPGILKTCNALESIINSDLRCFYDQTCFSTLLSMYNVDMTDRLPLPSDTLAIAVLNSSIPSRYLPTMTVFEIFQQLFVEDWQISSNFEGYYNTCAPSACIYTYNKRMDVLFIVSTVISITGGLLIILRLFIPSVVWLLSYIIEHRFTQHLHWYDRDTNSAGGIE